MLFWPAAVCNNTFWRLTWCVKARNNVLGSVTTPALDRAGILDAIAADLGVG